MLSAPTLDVPNFPEDDWLKGPSSPTGLYRAASVGNSWGVTSFGRGFDWANNVKSEQTDSPVHDKDVSAFRPDQGLAVADESYLLPHLGLGISRLNIPRPASFITSSRHQPQAQSPTMTLTCQTRDQPISQSPPQSPAISPRLTSSPIAPSATPRTPFPQSPSTTRPRRRSSQQRVSLIAGRVSIAPIEPPSPPPVIAPSLERANSTSSFLSVATSVGPPSPRSGKESFLDGRSISEFFIEGDIGRGAYGLVKRAREINKDGSLGPSLVIKQIIKSRILADCWKKHPRIGTIPIEIYVMSAISSTSYILPPRRPWNPARSVFPPSATHGPESNAPSELELMPDEPWVEGKVVKGHPNICPLLDYFEDHHYYYLVLPATAPDPGPGGPTPPSDLFELVETYPQGLPPRSIRSYLGQIADALCFLHAHGIVHRDVKDENVVLDAAEKCILIDFGSSGLVKKHGWDTFSGTLDYAGPEILRGERYYGKEQDVWAFGVVAYVLLVGECPFMTPEEAQDGLQSPFANASIALDERCAEGKESEGLEVDGGGALGDAADLVRACLTVEVAARPTFEKILKNRFLWGDGGWTDS